MAAPGTAPPVTESELRRVGSLARHHFGFDTLRPGQGEILVRVLRGESVLAILPTGAGKSLCYMLPALHEEGLTLVVSPLIALMKDQLDAMPPALRERAVAVNSSMEWREVAEVLEGIREGKYRMVYAAPERMRQVPFLAALLACGVKRLVVDEAHCVSLWGHDFRPDYLSLGEVRARLGSPPVLAMTATAPERVRRDILARLGGGMSIVATSSFRPNLRLETVLCRDADEKLAHLITLCRETRGPGLVYASSRDKCEQLAAALRSHGLNADFYHAGVDDRSARQDAFMLGAVDVLVATVAFGMGIDKSDIRFILHHDPPASLEGYYQEAGRAGRDGQPARCVLLATAADGGALARKAKGDLPDKALVMALLQKLRDWSEGRPYVTIPRDALADGEGEEVKARVALSILEEAGHVTRLPDLPHAFMVRAYRGPLVPHSNRALTAFDLAPLLGVSPEGVEDALLAAEARRELRFQTAERHVFLRLHEGGGDVEGILARYRTLADARGSEVMDYVRATDCLHRHLCRHLGDTVNPPCNACDRCLRIPHEIARDVVPDDDASLRLVLETLDGVKGMGETNLVKTLRGEPDVPGWAMDLPQYGKLGLRSTAKLKGLVAELRRSGLVDQETLSHGGVTLRITDKGRAALGAGTPLAASGAPAPARSPSRAPARRAAAPEPEPEEGPLDAAGAQAFEVLRAWRRERADQMGVPPFVVAHDSTLRALARARPTTREALLAVKGIGPRRADEYGEEILRIFRRLGE